MADRQVAAGDLYVDKVKKLIPSEVSAGLLAINSLVPLVNSSVNQGFMLAITTILVVLCWFYLSKYQSVSSKLQLVFTALIAFPIWALNIMVSRFDLLAAYPYVPGALLVLVTLVAPFVAPASEAQP